MTPLQMKCLQAAVIYGKGPKGFDPKQSHYGVPSEVKKSYRPWLALVDLGMMTVFRQGSLARGEPREVWCEFKITPKGIAALDATKTQGPKP